jgi:hypothetical protein
MLPDLGVIGIIHNRFLRFLEVGLDIHTYSVRYCHQLVKIVNIRLVKCVRIFFELVVRLEIRSTPFYY